MARSREGASGWRWQSIYWVGVNIWAFKKWRALEDTDVKWGNPFERDKAIKRSTTCSWGIWDDSGQIRPIHPSDCHALSKVTWLHSFVRLSARRGASATDTRLLCTLGMMKQLIFINYKVHDLLLCTRGTTTLDPVRCLWSYRNRDESDLISATIAFSFRIEQHQCDEEWNSLLIDFFRHSALA